MHRPQFTIDRLTVTCILSFCLLVAGLSVGLVLGELRDELALSGLLAAAHSARFGIGLLLAGIVGLRVVARLGRPLMFWSSCTAIAVGVLVISIGRSWPVTLVGATVSGFACAFLVMLMPGIVADHHGEHRASAFAIINGFPGLAGITFSLVIGAVLAAGGTWRLPYAILTVAIGVAVFLAGRRVAIPPSHGDPVDVLPLFRLQAIRGPWLHIVHAVMVEFPVGIWAVVYLKEVGGASSGLAAALGAVWGLCLFASRMLLPKFVAAFGVWSRSIAFATAASGAAVMWFGPSLGVRVVGLVIVGLGAGPLYPLAVDRLYQRAGADTVALGAVTALGSGAAVTVGPLLLGLLADAVGLRHALLVVPVLAVLGIWTSRPAREAEATMPATPLQVELVSP